MERGGVLYSPFTIYYLPFFTCRGSYMDSKHSTDKVFLRSQYAAHYRRAGRARWSVEARPDYLVLFLLAGKASWQAGNEGGELPARTAWIIDYEMPARVSAERAEYLLLSLSPAFVLDCAVRMRLTRADARISFRASRIEQDERLARLARDIAEELQQEEAGQELVVAALVEQLVAHLLRHYANIRRADELELSRAGLVDRRIRRAVELMRARLDTELPLEEIAAAAHLSPFHFSRLFKKLTGAPPHAYLAALRVARARVLLAETDLSITEIATRVGYASSSHFAKAFRQVTGLSPRAYRAAIIRGQRSEVGGL